MTQKSMTIQAFHFLKVWNFDFTSYTRNHQSIKNRRLSNLGHSEKNVDFVKGIISPD